MAARHICARTAGEVRSLLHRLRADASAPPVTVLTAHPGQGISWLLADLVRDTREAALVDARDASPSPRALRLLDRTGVRTALLVVDHADEPLLPGAAAARRDWADVARELARRAELDRRVRVLLCGTECGARAALRSLSGARAPVVALRPTDPCDTAAAARLLGRYDWPGAARVLCHFTGLNAHRLACVAEGVSPFAFQCDGITEPTAAFLRACAGAGPSVGIPLADAWRAVEPFLGAPGGDAFRAWLYEAHRRGVLWVYGGRAGPTRGALLPCEHPARAVHELAFHMSRLRRALADFDPVGRTDDPLTAR